MYTIFPCCNRRRLLQIKLQAVVRELQKQKKKVLHLYKDIFHSFSEESSGITKLQILNDACILYNVLKTVKYSDFVYNDYTNNAHSVCK